MLACLYSISLVVMKQPSVSDKKKLFTAQSGTEVGDGLSFEIEDGRICVTYWDQEGNKTVRYYASDVPLDEIPRVITNPLNGLIAGCDYANPPESPRSEPFKTHLAYVKERRSKEEGQKILEEALRELRRRRAS
ncbi:putative electron transport protein [Tropheryma whipplei str. Twist]|uniref:RNA polymerase-binding protein RbpA n=2 Tax=Tropheryma whipplei TaxID=2039 RepID=Q83MY3_TROWT|nr:putative electron transport protein [Tropheryma whipplei str. Twist]